MNNSTSPAVAQVLSELARKTEEAMVQQLGELVSKGLLVWERSELEIFQEPSFDNTLFKIGYRGRFLLKDEEYIRELEAQNASLRAQLDFQLPTKPERTRP